MGLHLSGPPSNAVSLEVSLADNGYAYVPAAAMLAELEVRGLSDWDSFAASWSDLGLDRYMADGGRYRRRRHAVFEVSTTEVKRLPHQPHFQMLSHNPLNGGVPRWFEPIELSVAGHSAFLSILSVCNETFAAAAHLDNPPWRVEAHQFRIEASEIGAGKPTPEGVHRDGVDWVFVMLVRRENIVGGETVIEDETGRTRDTKKLSIPGESIFLDDRRVRHGVTDVSPECEDRPSFRDVLVLTFKEIR